MAKTQTISYTKTGSNWANTSNAIDELNTDTATSAHMQAILPVACNSVTENLKEQTYTQVRTWTDENYVIYKNQISSFESKVNADLIALGWTIIDSTID
jgi:hypothetical protein